jgi:type I restriction enzyme, R subunit
MPGKLITEDYRVMLRGEINRTIQSRYASLQDFFVDSFGAGRRQGVSDALRDAGITLEVLQQAVPRAGELDFFDLAAHTAFDRKPRARKERVIKARKRNYFVKYGDQTRADLGALLEKYADHDITDLEDSIILELPPFIRLGTKTQYRRGVFGGRKRFSQALTEMERALYDAVHG